MFITKADFLIAYSFRYFSYLQNLIMKLFPILILTFFIQTCSAPNSLSPQQIIDKCIAYYGGNQWEKLHLGFTFRNHQYTLYRNSNKFIYTRTSITENPIVDSLFFTGTFKRYQEGLPLKVSDSMKKVYAASVNSVLYFFQIPKVLNDPAVIKERLEDAEIMGKNYHTLRITFGKEGGGSDFEDEFRYWINTHSFAIDYFAYSYQTDGGGTRFRSVKDRVAKYDMQFQNYLNYQPLSKNTPLDSLPYFFSNGDLLLVSEIVNENIRQLYSQKQ